MSQLISEQQATLDTFRAELLQEGIIQKGDSLGTEHDWVLLRFLRARKFNLKQSKTMLLNCLDWRKTVGGAGIDDLYRRVDPYDYPGRDEVFKSWPMHFHKTDKHGRPINIQSFGGIDTQSLYKAITPEKHWEAIVVNAESLPREVLPAASRAAGRPIDTVFVIVDLQGFGLSKFWQIKTLIKDSFKVSQDYFPETMGHLAVINAPYSFSAIWAAVKPWLAKETQDKVEILGSDYQHVLLDAVDAENLPQSLGGTCTCHAEGGCHVSSAGPWMENRKERREKWLKGEIESPGLLPTEEQLDVVPNDQETTSTSADSARQNQELRPDNEVHENGLMQNGVVHGEPVDAHDPGK